MTFEERIEIVQECCLHRRIVLFQDHSIFDLLQAEIIENGFGNLYFPEGRLDADLNARAVALGERLRRDKHPITLERAELVALLLFTHEKQDLYANLKKTMTGKGKTKEARQPA